MEVLEEEPKDKKTFSYFNKNTPTYTAKRYRTIINFVNNQKKEKASLIDVGCGDGTVLKAFKEETDIVDFMGMDISGNYLKLTKEQVGCDTFKGSILDIKLPQKIDRTFDYVIVGAILHHLIGDNRDESKEMAKKALKNAFDLLSPAGYLIISEPTYSPKESMDKVFNIKNFITKFTSDRINILGYDNNIGAPVVSYYDKEILTDMMQNYTSQKPIFENYNPHKISLSLKLVGVKETGALLLIYQK
jgi:SAM-dependent methyltransferase